MVLPNEERYGEIVTHDEPFESNFEMYHLKYAGIEHEDDVPIEGNCSSSLPLFMSKGCSGVNARFRNTLISTL